MEGPGLAPETIHRQQAHQAAIAANFHEGTQPILRGEAEHVSLRVGQPVVMQELDDFMVETSDELGRRIVLPQPPNFGKSFISALCMDLAGVGKPVPETGAPVRGLFLTSRQVGIKQALETFSWLTPHLKARRYAGNVKLSSYDTYDVIAATYSAAESMAEDKWNYLTRGRDIVALDEIHRGIGRKTVARILQACEVNNPTVLASTATTRFNDEHTVANRLGIQRSTSGMTECEAIFLGAANEAHLLALYSGEEISFGSKRSSITEEDMRPLMEREGRNKLILDTMVDMAANGRPGITQLIPGDDSLHARNIAKWAKKRTFVDPYTGKSRPLKVEALGNFQSKKENMNIIRDFNEGRLHVLTFTKYIVETFDCPNGLGYVFAASPNGSEVDMRQFAGRGARFYGLPTIFLTLIDKYSSLFEKRIWTFFDVFGQDKLYQGKVIRRASLLPPISTSADSGRADSNRKEVGAGAAPGRPKRDSPAKPATPELHFSESVQRALDKAPAGAILDELLVTGRREEVPDDYIHITDLPTVREGLITPEGARHILLHRPAKDGRPLFINVHVGGFSQFVLAREADRAVRARTIDFKNNVTRMEITNFLEGQGWPRMSFGAFINLCAEAGAAYKIVKKGAHLQPADAKKFFARLLKTPLVDPETELAIASVAQVVGGGIKTTMYMRVMRKRMDYYQKLLRSRRKGLQPQVYRLVESLSLEGVHELLTDYFNSSPMMQRAIGSLALIDGIIAQTQDMVREAYKAQGIVRQPTLSKIAVQGFLAPYEPGYTPLPTPPSPLDLTYALSSHGKRWSDHAACLDEDPELFSLATEEHTTAGRTQIAKAKAICADCSVKGDCLHAALTTGSDTIAGGFTERERGQIYDDARQWLKNSRRKTT